MNIGLHHLVKVYRVGHPDPIIIPSSKFRSFVDHFIYVIGFFSVLILVPQLINILNLKNSEGVSLITWGGFLISSSFWLFYGIIHKEKPIILTNLGALVLDILIIAAIFYYHQGPIF